VTLPLLLAEFNDEALGAELRGLRLLSFEPSRIHFSRVHIDAHLGERMHARQIGIRKVSGKASHRPEILRIRRSNMKLVGQNLEIAEKFGQEFRKDFGAPLFEE